MLVCVYMCVCSVLYCHCVCFCTQSYEWVCAWSCVCFTPLCGNMFVKGFCLFIYHWCVRGFLRIVWSSLIKLSALKALCKFPVIIVVTVTATDVVTLVTFHPTAFPQQNPHKQEEEREGQQELAEPGGQLHGCRWAGTSRGTRCFGWWPGSGCSVVKVRSLYCTVVLHRCIAPSVITWGVGRL